MLVWFDCETTGLAADKHAILEVAAIVTDDALNEVARFHSTVKYPTDPFGAYALFRNALDDETIAGWSRRTGIDPTVIRMHAESGLWLECMHEAAPELYEVDSDFAYFISRYATTTRWDGSESTDSGVLVQVKPQLAGSTISFDRGFIEQHMPCTNAALHYRNVDVSSLNELGRRFWPDAYRTRSNGSSPAHRAMADIEDSLRVCKHYLARLRDVGAPAVETMDGAL